MILIAERYKIKTVPDAEAQEYEIISKAKAYKDNKIKVSKAEMERFKKRVPGYRGMPELYMLE